MEEGAADLCEICRGLFDLRSDLWKKKQRSDHSIECERDFRTMGSLIKSALTCAFCLFVLDLGEKGFRQDVAINTMIKLRRYQKRGWANPSREGRGLGVDEDIAEYPSGQAYEGAAETGYEPFNTLIIIIQGTPFCVVCISDFAEAENNAARYIGTRVTYQDLRSNALYEHVKILLLECQLKHDHCLKKLDRLLPKRILDVDSKSSGDLNEPESTFDKGVRLVTNLGGEMGEYVALSYCWGEEQPRMTKKHCLAEYEHSIDLTILPRTIRDAVYVTRWLGYKYLWVDSLCIIQNDASDKAVEISKMGSIYMNAILTIGAASAEKASDGFLGPRKHLRCLKMPFVCYDGTPGEVQVREITRSIDQSLKDPLNERGWALQERILSQRFLSFEMRNIGYKCRSHTSTVLLEDFDRQAGDLTHFPASVFQNKGSADLQLSNPMDVTPKIVVTVNELSARSSLWKQFATEYSQTKLSSWKDQYDAIGGLVKVLSDAWGYEYLAGLWKEDLSAELLWIRTGRPNEPRWGKDNDLKFEFRLHSNNKTALTGSEYCFSPSWSWLSVAGKVHFRSHLHIGHIEYVKCEIDPLSKDSPYGEIKRAELTVRAPAITAVEALKIFRKGDCYVSMDDGSDHLSHEQKNDAVFILGGHSGYEITALILFPCGTHAFQGVGILEFDIYDELKLITDVAEAFGYELIEDKDSNGDQMWRCTREKKLFLLV